MPFPIQITIKMQAPPRRVELALRAARQRINFRLAEMLATMTRSNFGPVDNGYRPAPWPAYKNNYGPGKRKGMPATLIGKTGVLQASVKPLATMQWGQVSAQGSRPYAFAHQFGSPKTNLEARPYFPVYRTPTGFLLLPRSETEMLTELSRLLQQVLNQK